MSQAELTQATAPTVDTYPLAEKVGRLKQLVDQVDALATELGQDITQARGTVADIIGTLVGAAEYLKVDATQVQAFLRKPYVTIPRRESEWFLVVPRFIDFQMGWLYQQTESFNVFLVNRYVDWLYPLPQELKRELEFKAPALKAVVDHGFLVTDPRDMDSAFEKYRGYVTRREEPGRIRVNPAKEFDLICQLIRDGILPFQRQAVAASDLRAEDPPKLELRPYQVDAWQQFLQLGSVGIYWSPGVGKMFLALWALAKLKGPKLVITPTRTLVEEWTRKIRQYVPTHLWSETVVTTLASAHKYLDRSYTLVVYDEHQHLPANTYARLALIRSKYRMGLSATPFREDGRVDLIFALTGFPLGLAWGEFFRLGVIQKPTAYLYIVPNQHQKLRQLRQLVQTHAGRTLVFCDSLELGKQVSELLTVPFVHGGSAKRLVTIGRHPVTVVSRVADEGIDITDLENVFEIDFLFGSRRQELQRLGRLLHSRFKGFYAILMTEPEYAAYGKRLYSLYEKGFQVRIERS